MKFTGYRYWGTESSGQRDVVDTWDNNKVVWKGNTMREQDEQLEKLNGPYRDMAANAERRK